MSATMAGPDGEPRCRWCGAAPEFLVYHDTEWGFPVGDDRLRLQAAGLAALLLSRTPQQTPEQIRAVLRAAALDLHEPGHDHETGFGLLRLPD